VRHDYFLTEGVPEVASVSAETATQIRESIHEYPAKLVSLPPATWETSVCIWMGDHWDILVDLWTEDEGRSDLVLQVRVSEVGSEYLMTIYMVYVP
jgi:hypothetical protein